MSFLRSLLSRAAGVATPSRDVENAQLLPAGAHTNFVIHLLALADSARRNGEANGGQPFLTFREADSLMVGVMTMRNLFIAYEGRMSPNGDAQNKLQHFAESVRTELRQYVDALRVDESALNLPVTSHFLDSLRTLADLVERTFPHCRVGELRVALMTTSFTYAYFNRAERGYGWEYADYAKR